MKQNRPRCFGLKVCSLVLFEAQFRRRIRPSGSAETWQTHFELWLCVPNTHEPMRAAFFPATLRCPRLLPKRAHDSPDEKMDDGQHMHNPRFLRSHNPTVSPIVVPTQSQTHESPRRDAGLCQTAQCSYEQPLSLAPRRQRPARQCPCGAQQMQQDAAKQRQTRVEHRPWKTPSDNCQRNFCDTNLAPRPTRSFSTTSPWLLDRRCPWNPEYVVRETLFSIRPSAAWEGARRSGPAQRVLAPFPRITPPSAVLFNQRFGRQFFKAKIYPLGHPSSPTMIRLPCRPNS